MGIQAMTGYPSIDRPWIKYYSSEAVNAPLPQCSVYENIFQHNKEHLQDTALLYFGKKISYKELFSQVERAKRAFLSCGVRQGDNVALCVPATPEAIYTILALNRIGAAANMLNPTFSQEQLKERINETGARVLLVANELYGRVEHILPQTCVETVISYAAVNALGPIVRFLKRAKNIPNTVPWNAFLRRGNEHEEDARYVPDTAAVMVYSSGTTGASKGILLTNDSINATILQYETVGFDIKRQDRYFAQIPIWFSTGIVVTMLVPLCLGLVTILEPMYNFEVFYEHIIKYEPHFLITATGLLDYLMSKRRTAPAYGNFKYLAIGGEYVTPHAERKFNEWLKENGNDEGIHKGYGMCELGGTVTSTNAVSNTIGASGVPFPKIVVAAFDIQTGEELPYGKRGEICVQSPGRMLGYYHRPEETAKYFKAHRDGTVWAHTGDMGYVTSDGNVHVDGRLSDSYSNQKDERIYLFDIERAILDDGGVRQCRVIAVEVDGILTHVAHMVLSRPEENAAKAVEAIQSICKEKLPENHMPHFFKLYEDALPVSASGKLDVLTMRRKTSEPGLIRVE